MNQSEMDALVPRLASLYPADPVPPEQLRSVEDRLGIVLPNDLKALSLVYAGGMLGGIEHYDIGNPGREYSIVAKTNELRVAIGLPHEYVALADPPISLILLHTRNTSAEPTTVVWLDAVDMERYLSGAACLGTQPDLFHSYADFFRFLLEREEEERAEV